VGAEGNVRDIVLSVMAGGAMMVLFASVFGFILLAAWGLSRARRWWDERGGRDG
jgi:hypothetical protein